MADLRTDVATAVARLDQYAELRETRPEDELAEHILDRLLTFDRRRLHEHLDRLDREHLHRQEAGPMTVPEPMQPPTHRPSADAVAWVEQSPHPDDVELVRLRRGDRLTTIEGRILSVLLIASVGATIWAPSHHWQWAATSIVVLVLFGIVLAGAAEITKKIKALEAKERR